MKRELERKVLLVRQRGPYGQGNVQMIKTSKNVILSISGIDLTNSHLSESFFARNFITNYDTVRGIYENL